MPRWMTVFVFLVCGLVGACVFVDDESERGFVECGDDNRVVTCQPGTYCTSPLLASCMEGCVSDANCLEHEKCLKDDDHDRVGSCIPTKRAY